MSCVVYSLFLNISQDVFLGKIQKCHYVSSTREKKIIHNITVLFRGSGDVFTIQN